MSIDVRAAAEGRSEMAFWPAAVAAYIYADVGGWVNLLLLGVFAFSGALTYIFLRNVKSAISTGKNISQTKSNIGRDDTNQGIVERSITTFEELQRLFPENHYASKTVYIGIFVDIFGGLYLLMQIGGSVLDSTNPTVAGVILFALPILNVFVILAAIIWNM